MENNIMKDEYKKYYTNLLKQMKEQNFSKVAIEAQKVMYETREDLFEEFCNRYDFEINDTEIVFEPEFEESIRQ